MGFFDLFQQADIDQGVKEYLATPGAVLLDVSTSEEYRDGHIPGSKNVRFRLLTRWPLSQKIKIWHCMSTATLAPGAVRLPACCGVWDIAM